ncbi:MAG TPA: hypothetical protein DD666_13590 [Advenella kashmirensis]|uniref:Uncharacterized protein n=1 Tax=Advenella kashmirensis TaxID=310575 RepID=A0A356LI36_9BURK|nr:hypothetical protein [Advenella kashmirensis]
MALYAKVEVGVSLNLEPGREISAVLRYILASLAASVKCFYNNRPLLAGFLKKTGTPTGVFL